MKHLICCALFVFSVCLSAQNTVYQTRVFDSNIKTLQVGSVGETFSSSLLELNGSVVLQVSFDELSHDNHFYSYRVLHCNADWTLSNISENEYIDGFTNANIIENRLSEVTTVPYTHYSFNVPDNNMRLRISGNYVAQIYESNQTDKPVAQVCFSVVEPKVTVSGNVRGNTDTELNRRLQQLDFYVNLNGYTVRDVHDELRVVVRQNNRTDNQVTNIKPTFIAASKLSYINNRNLIFEGGSEYHRFDISSVHAASFGIEAFQYNRPYYDVFLTPNIVQKSNVYSYEPDVNGRFVINHQEAFYDKNVEADYLRVHFILDANEPFFDGQVYIGGEFNNNLLNENSRMKYDFQLKKYYFSTFLKQGGYNYQYWFVPKGQTKSTVERVDGSFWQTGNEYTVYVYHRPWGERYDRLVGVKTISSN